MKRRGFLSGLISGGFTTVVAGKTLEDGEVAQWASSYPALQCPRCWCQYQQFVQDGVAVAREHHTLSCPDVDRGGLTYEVFPLKVRVVPTRDR